MGCENEKLWGEFNNLFALPLYVHAIIYTFQPSNTSFSLLICFLKNTTLRYMKKIVKMPPQKQAQPPTIAWNIGVSGEEPGQG